MAETGRIAVFHGVGKPFEIREMPVPEPGPHDLVVRVTRANVCGSDLHIWRGDTDLSRLGITYGIVLGHEMVGTVARIGGRVRGDALGRPLKEGDRVAFTYYVPCGHCPVCLRGSPQMCLQSLATPVRPCDMPPHFTGGFGDYYAVNGRQSVFVVPQPVTDAEAAGANCALAQVVWGLEVARVRLGDSVVVQGAGGLGLFACAVARAMGAGRVVAVDGVPARLDLARAMGADEVVDMRAVPDPKDRVQVVMRLTDGWGADVVVEVVGTPDAVPEGVRMLARGGRYVEIGNINPRRTYAADPSLLVGFNRSILGVSLYPAEALRQALGFLARERGRFAFDRLLSRDYPLAEIDRAFSEADAFKSDPTSITRASIVPVSG